MITISLCMIVKNEEKTLARCLDSVQDLVDEINIVDTGSTDRTKEVARRYTERLFDFQWVDDFAAARNYSFSKATLEYILWLDADDFLLEKDRNKFLTLKKTLDPAFDMVTMNYNLSFDTQGQVISKIRRERLVKREKNFCWHDPVHEYLEFKGNVLNSDIAVCHGRVHQNKARNLGIYERLLAKGETFTPRDHLNYANELLDNQRLREAIDHYLNYLEETESSFAKNNNTTQREDSLWACNRLALCYQQLGDKEKELEWLVRAMRYDAPQAETCCRIGLWFQEQNMFHTAIRWFELATKLKEPEDLWSHVNIPSYTWLPHQHLTILYGKIGELEKAYQHNEIVRSHLPEDRNLLHNKGQLERLIKEKKKTKSRSATDPGVERDEG